MVVIYAEREIVGHLHPATCAESVCEARNTQNIKSFEIIEEKFTTTSLLIKE
jgi:hypothetical protein